MTVIRHKRGTGIPSPSDLKVGEIAIDTSTGTAYTKAGDGRIVPIGGNSSGGDGGGSGGPVAWDQITGKPTEFPPAAHTHQQSEVDGLEGRLDAIEGSITDGGSNTITATASGTLANGDTVIVNSDGTVSAISGIAQSAGSDATYVDNGSRPGSTSPRGLAAPRAAPRAAAGRTRCCCCLLPPPPPPPPSARWV